MHAAQRLDRVGAVDEGTELRRGRCGPTQNRVDQPRGLARGVRGHQAVPVRATVEVRSLVGAERGPDEVAEPVGPVLVGPSEPPNRLSMGMPYCPFAESRPLGSMRSTLVRTFPSATLWALPPAT